jgi:hypothetical protein
MRGCKVSKKGVYAVFVSDPAGWDDPCPYSFREVFFGADAEDYVTPCLVRSARLGSCGFIQVEGYRRARAIAGGLNVSGHWPRGQRPVYAVAKL